MCLFRSYHLLSTTLVKPGSSLAPSRLESDSVTALEDFFGRERGSYAVRPPAGGAGEEVAERGGTAEVEVGSAE